MPVYLDNSATTMVAPEVLDAMLPYLRGEYGNPSSIHWMGDAASKAMRTARKQMADALGCYPSEVFFTSGGTESDNIALFGTAGRGKVITTQIEHSAILEACGHLRNKGNEVELICVDHDGIADPDHLRKIITDHTKIVSVMAVNNEIGTIQPIKEMSDIAHEHGALFHTDAVQAFTKMSIKVREMGIDMLSISGHKIHGPKGIGALYIQEDVDIEPIMYGGGQELGVRPSTENVPGIVGLGKATEIAMDGMDADITHMTKIRDTIIDSISAIPGTTVNGSLEKRLCNNAHFRFDGIRGMDLVLKLSKEHIAVSTASACAAGSTEPSHVMTAIGLNPMQALSALRISLSRYNTMEDADTLAEVLPKIVASLR